MRGWQPTQYKTGWTDERIATAKRLWLEGKSASQIAKELGNVTRNGVIGKLTRLGLSGSTAGRPNTTPRAAVRVAASPPSRLPKGSGSAIYKGDPRTSPLQKKLDAIVANEAARAVEPLPAEEPHTGNVVPLLSLGAHCCRWPIGTPGTDGFGFCPEKRMPGDTYCPDHKRRAYVAMDPRKGATGKDLARSLRRYL